ncbi:GGDEF domain-containing protein [Grimontia sp. NTOU-MAR1]|uniref:GGDEF domain-containing protein n=1 Tax=Grimontia sp. NTOU-MAR1 TaxID=3111011 RepID=UPI002DB82057|nr:sensor domain-containing diguanylate cyclase [Grimontia sp. NTOU-MAR1]WRW00374.1 sensor domain-containing diguanylate cyclase [Grimontia sp. NTOU-MAR1]
MKKPELPIDETHRLQVLHHLNILDTGNEERFDRLTRLAKQMFGTKIAAISFIDTNRQWVKSGKGLEREYPRDISFCAHAILDSEPMVVNDTLSDTRFSDNPLVLGDLKIRFYAGYPIRHVSGSLLGALSIADDEPRGFDDYDLRCMKDIVDLVENELASMQLSTQDHLTGLLNEHGFEVICQNSLNMCERLNAPASLAFFDVRELKTINKLRGNVEGDRALAFFADLLKFGFRDSDVLARLESDKFAVLMNNTPIANTQEILDRFKERVDRYSVENALPYTLDYYVGVSWVEPESNYDFSNLLDTARNFAIKAKG